MDTFLTSNERQWRLLRTVVQGALGVIVANIDMLIGRAVLEPAWRAVVVALVMAPLSPVMAKLGTASIKRKGLDAVADAGRLAKGLDQPNPRSMSRDPGPEVDKRKMRKPHR